MSLKTDEKGHPMIKEELLQSFLENVYENQAVKNANQPNKAISITKIYELFLKIERNKMFRMVGNQGDYLKILRKERNFSIMYPSAGLTFTLTLGCESF